MCAVTLLWVCPAGRLSAQCPDGTVPPCRPNTRVLASPPSLVVLPFENRSADTLDAYLAATLTEDVTAALGAHHAVILLSPRAEHRTAHVLRAGVRRTGATLDLALELERPSTGELLPVRISWPVRGIADLPDTLASSILAALGLHVPRPAGVARESHPPVDPTAYDLYLRARYQIPRRTEQSMARALGLLSEALARDSGFGLAWAGRARALHFAYRWGFSVPGYPRDQQLEREVAAAERATELDSTNAEVWLTRGLADQDVDPTTRVGTLRATWRALALDSLNPDAWFQLGVTLEETGDTSGARVAWRRAVSVNPAYTPGLAFLANHYWWVREYDTAGVWADSAVAMDPTYLTGRWAAAEVALARGRLEEAEAHAEAARRIARGPEVIDVSVLARVALLRGDTARAQAILAEALTRSDSLAPVLHGVVALAELYAALGAKEQAIRELERYQPRREVHFQMHLRLDPPLDPLRGEPRFRALLAETAGR